MRWFFLKRTCSVPSMQFLNASNSRKVHQCLPDVACLFLLQNLLHPDFDMSGEETTTLDPLRVSGDLVRPLSERADSALLTET